MQFFLNKSFIKFSKKAYFTYPCPRKLDEIVKISMFEKETPFNIKQIWTKYYEEKNSSLGLDVSGGEMNIILKK